MVLEKRQSERFGDIGRVDIPDLCALPGVLDNISRAGCRVHYQFPVVVDLNDDYEMRITFAGRSADRTFSLLCHPEWAKEDSSRTQIGFKILPSTDFARLGEYIGCLSSDSEEQRIDSQIADSVCRIIT